MNTKIYIRNFGIGLLVTAVLIIIGVINVSAATTNDEFGAATVITSFPFVEATSTLDATVDPNDPIVCGHQYKSIWFMYTPDTDTSLVISTNGDSQYNVTLSIFQLDNENLILINCLEQQQVTSNLDVSAGTTYYFELNSWQPAGWESYPAPPFTIDGGNVTLNIAQVLPPGNDNFADAMVVSSLPSINYVDTTDATTEPGEPNGCLLWTFQKTVWYSFTPSTSGMFTTDSSGGYYPILAVYTGTELDNLQNIACNSSSWDTARITLFLEAGTTYYFQTFVTEPYYRGMVINFSLYSTPPPKASFTSWPGNASIYDSLYISNNSYDPYGVGIQSCWWDFGDGTTATDCNPIYRFSSDGDYTVQLTVTTVDGRTATTSLVVPIRTHDVGITRFVVPISARAGQTKQINIYVKNSFYSETVQVDLYKSSPSGWYEWVGSSTQYVPVRPANRAQLFTFAYTFTSNDADQGKVTFKSVVTVINERDAYMPDNEMISVATKVAH